MSEIVEYPKWVHSKEKSENGQPKRSILVNNAAEEKAAAAEVAKPAPKE